jgi:hypothetical protein
MKRDWQSPSPSPDAIDFAAAISELEDSRRAFITASVLRAG